MLDSWNDEAPQMLPLTTTLPTLLDEGSDATFRRLVHKLLAFSGRLEVIRNGFGILMGLTGIQYTILITVAHLSENKGVGVKAVARHLSLSGAFVTIEVGKLQNAGLVSKKPNPNDRRRVLLRITKKAHRMLSELAPTQAGINNVLFKPLKKEQFKGLVEIAEYLVESADQAMLISKKRVKAQNNFNSTISPSHCQNDAISKERTQ